MPHEGALNPPSVFRERAWRGRIVHARHDDVDHRFDYRLWMSLSRLPDSGLPALIRPRPSAYLAAEDVRTMTEQPDATVWLLTQPSLFGRSFNPVSFYLLEVCGRAQAVVAHVTNTPWDDRHCYVLHGDRGTWRFDKRFHVSPFMPMHLRYRWRFVLEHQRIRISMQLSDQGRRVFSALLDIAPTSASPWSLRLRHPAQNLATLARIYWQAFRLKLKGARFHARPEHLHTDISHIH